MTELSRHAVSLETTEPRLIAAAHARVPMGSIPRVFGRYLDQVYAAKKAGSVELDGQNVFLYHWSPERPDELDVDFGVGATKRFAAVGSVVPVMVPGGECARTTHWGSYAGLPGAHSAIHEWLRVNPRRHSGVSWEVYGHWTDDESRLRTDIYYLLEPA